MYDFFFAARSIAGYMYHYDQQNCDLKMRAENSTNWNVEYRDGKGDKIAMPCTHSTVI